GGLGEDDVVRLAHHAPRFLRVDGAEGKSGKPLAPRRPIVPSPSVRHERSRYQGLQRPVIERNGEGRDESRVAALSMAGRVRAEGGAPATSARKRPGIARAGSTQPF